METKENIIAEVPSYGGPHPYSYTDSLVECDIIHWYKLGSVSILGDTVWHDSLSMSSKGYKVFKFALYQSYPNPFKEKTYIRYTVPGRLPSSEMLYISLKVYDITGRLVRTLVSKELPPGEYRVEWDGKTDWRRRVSAGVYFYRLQVGERVSPRKLIFLY